MDAKSLLFAGLVVAAAISLNPVLATQNTGVVAKVNASDSKTAVVKNTANKLSINQANQEQLEAIPGIGAKKAQAILEYIKKNGPIKNQQQLMEVKGIGAKLAEKISGFVSF
ncbi:ComEA family DNA-binding protein [Rheinheimera sp. 4Y26]|uniref:ComEA family DNA-binding protein n=1 Tax=Rheinheimera sp. 4Y26 TaxID=2977811 RepID=UPI0021B0B8FF|nr:helix-hairpin-helix domain-containing protein [Rheinheimera sp. 4Y26]MCT6700859.1 helix-hairpin-helix domain-containing protein [Rheinheimera sp. 4Y26]